MMLLRQLLAIPLIIIFVILFIIAEPQSL